MVWPRVVKLLLCTTYGGRYIVNKRLKKPLRNQRMAPKQTHMAAMAVCKCCTQNHYSLNCHVRKGKKSTDDVCSEQRTMLSRKACMLWCHCLREDEP